MSGAPPVFRCVCGEPARRADPARAHWSRFTGYGDFGAITWYEDEAAARAARPAGLLPARPPEGSVQWVRVGHGFADAPGRAFWCLHETPLAWLNGYGTQALEGRLADLALVRCRLLGLEPLSKQAAVGRAAVEQVLTLADLLALPLADGPVEDDTWRGMPLSLSGTPIRDGDLVMVQADLEGDCGAWAVLHDTADATDLLMLADWGAHEDHLWAGRARLREGRRMIGAGLPPVLRGGGSAS